MQAKIDDNPIGGRTLVASFVTSAARSFSSTTSQANKNASQIELTSAKMRRAVPGVGRSSEKFRNKAKRSNEGRLIMKEVGVNIVIVFLRKRRTIVVRLGKSRRCTRVQWYSEMQMVLRDAKRIDRPRIEHTVVEPSLAQLEGVMTS